MFILWTGTYRVYPPEKRSHIPFCFVNYFLFPFRWDMYGYVSVPLPWDRWTSYVCRPSCFALWSRWSVSDARIHRCWPRCRWPAPGRWIRRIRARRRGHRERPIRLGGRNDRDPHGGSNGGGVEVRTTAAEQQQGTVPFMNLTKGMKIQRNLQENTMQEKKSN